MSCGCWITQRFRILGFGNANGADTFMDKLLNIKLGQNPDIQGLLCGNSHLPIMSLPINEDLAHT